VNKCQNKKGSREIDLLKPLHGKGLSVSDAALSLLQKGSAGREGGACLFGLNTKTAKGIMPIRSTNFVIIMQGVTQGEPETWGESVGVHPFVWRTSVADSFVYHRKKRIEWKKRKSFHNGKKNENGVDVC